MFRAVPQPTHSRPVTVSRLALLVLSIALTFGAAPSAAQSTPPATEATLGVIPRPRRLETRPGTFTISARTVVWTDAASASEGRKLARMLERGTGLALAVRTGGTPPTANVIELRRDRALMDTLGAEGYRLRVRPGRVVARSAGDAGLFYAAQTMRQLLPPAALRAAPIVGVRWTVQAVDIEDAPRFAWRGAHLDVSRHFMPKEFVKKYIDLLALQKMNSFHWHLTEDQGWRIQIKRYPRLTEVGGCRKETQVAKHRDPFVGDGTRYCGYYTQDQVRDVVAYAAARHVTIIPEIEMPGHSVAAIAAYPELGCRATAPEVRTKWGISDDILCPKEETFAFLEGVLTEVMELFPGERIHIGGDEAPKKAWQESPAAQAVIRREGLKDEHELQSYFVRRIEKFLNAHGRRLVGWDEIVEGGLSPTATVMYWRDRPDAGVGVQGGIDPARVAVKQGNSVIMTPNQTLYFDRYQADSAGEPLAIGGLATLRQVYGYDPIPSDFGLEEAKRVLGAQANVWTEYMATPEHVEYMVLPRMIALAEVLWSPREARDWGSFTRRLPAQLKRLDALGVKYRAP